MKGEGYKYLLVFLSRFYCTSSDEPFTLVTHTHVWVCIYDFGRNHERDNLLMGNNCTSKNVPLVTWEVVHFICISTYCCVCGGGRDNIRKGLPKSIHVYSMRGHKMSLLAGQQFLGVFSWSHNYSIQSCRCATSSQNLGIGRFVCVLWWCNTGRYVCFHHGSGNPKTEQYLDL